MDHPWDVRTSRGRCIFRAICWARELWSREYYTAFFSSFHIPSRHFDPCLALFLFPFESTTIRQIPVYLSEISPPAFRATFAGLAYQMGNMISGASAQIEAGEWLLLC
jgi:hypothetical protein